jgi:UDP-N-acetylglucosamine--N-acetylmuramyl-(pentapeptide) pyrophosphoryl-undecaprenol N-acetylglucosamine transferase
MSVAELCVAKKPVVFVPFPFAAEDHQTANAQSLVNKNAAVLIKDENVKIDLVNTIIALANNVAAQQTMKDAIAMFAISDADEVIARGILNNLHNPSL